MVTTDADADLVIRGATILSDGMESRGHDIRVRAGRISAVEPPGRTSPATVMNVPGRWVVPGLVDTHVHLGGAGTPGRDEAEHTDPVRARPRLEEHLGHGVTTVADLFGDPPAMFARRAMAAAEPGTLPRVLVAGQGLTGPGGHPTSTVYAWSERLAAGAAVETDDPACARGHVRRLAESDHADLVKIACSDLRGSIARLSPATLRAIVGQAHEHGLPVLAHVHSDEDAFAAVDAGVDGIEHIPAGPRLSDALLAMAGSGTIWTPTLAVMEALANADRPEDHLDAVYPDLPARLRPTPRALALAGGERTRARAGAARRILAAALDGRLAGAVSAGLRVAAGTDAGNNHTPHGWSLHRELHLLRAAGLGGDQVLAAATSTAADKLGVTGIGRIVAGGPADLLVLTEDPRDDLTALARPEHIVAAGRAI